jgi:hypothetical protein
MGGWCFAVLERQISKTQKIFGFWRGLFSMESVFVTSERVFQFRLRLLLYDMIYLLTAIGLTPGGSSTVHIYTQTIHRTTQLATIHRTTQLTKWEVCGPWPVFASYTLAFALQLRKKHGKTSVRLAEVYQSARWIIIIITKIIVHLRKWNKSKMKPDLNKRYHFTNYYKYIFFFRTSKS